MSKTVQYLTILCWVIWAIFYAFTSSIYVSTFHIDGAFQTASGLYRIDSGFFPGRDFFPYLGIGPAMVLFPFFKLFGSNMAASAISAQLVVLLCASFAGALVWHLFWKPRTFAESLCFSMTLLYAPVILAQFSVFRLPFWIEFAISPGHSLRPLRSFIPYAILSVFILYVRRPEKSSVTYIWAGALAGLAMLWSNDYAIPCFGFFGLAIISYSWSRNECNLKNASLYVIVALVAWSLLLTATTAGHPIEFLLYNFRDVRTDQWWFFGEYRAQSRIFTIGDLGKLWSKDTQLPVIIAFLLLTLSLRTKSVQHFLLGVLGLTIFASGALASIGGHVGGYFGPLIFWAKATSIIGAWRFIWIAYGAWRKPPLYLWSAVSCTFFVLAFAASLISWHDYRTTLQLVRNDSEKIYVPELGGYLDQKWREYIEMARQSNESAVFEEYWGLWSATKRIFPGWPVDSVIHALGKVREEAASRVSDAKLIVTTRGSWSPIWQPWNLTQNYWLYAELLRRWEPIYLSPATVVWRRIAKEREFSDASCEIGHDGTRITLGDSDTGFFEVKLNYELQGSGRFLLQVKNNISFGGGADGHVSIDPKGDESTFPIYREFRGEEYPVIVSGPNAHRLILRSCSAKKIQYVNPEILKTYGLITRWIVSQ